MPETTNIACSLTGPQLADRLAEISRLGAEALIDRGVEAGAQVLRFRATPGTRERLEGVIAAEAECCAFLEFELREDSDGLILTIGAPADGVPVAAELGDAFAGARA